MQNRIIYSLVFLFSVTALHGMEPSADAQNALWRDVTSEQSTVAQNASYSAKATTDRMADKSEDGQNAQNLPDSALLIIQENNKNGYATALLPEFHTDRKHLYYADSKDWHDLGQNQLLNSIKNSIGNLNEEEQYSKKQFIVYAYYEGALTALNYIAQEHPEQVKMLILDNAVASGNSALFYNAQKKSPFLSSLPLSYYWLPYLEKLRTFSYSPAGKQPILNIQKISQNLPIMIVYHTNELSFDDAKALYAGLRSHGNTNTYLFPIEPGDSYNLTNTKQDEVCAIRKIMQQHALLPENASNVDCKNDLEKYQPEPDMNAYNQLVAKEKIFPYLDGCLKITAFGLVLGICMYTVFKSTSISSLRIVEIKC